MVVEHYQVTPLCEMNAKMIVPIEKGLWTSGALGEAVVATSMVGESKRDKGAQPMGLRWWEMPIGRGRGSMLRGTL